jgi:hypothetical protein
MRCTSNIPLCILVKICFLRPCSLLHYLIGGLRALGLEALWVVIHRIPYPASTNILSSITTTTTITSTTRDATHKDLVREQAWFWRSCGSTFKQQRSQSTPSLLYNNPATYLSYGQRGPPGHKIIRPPYEFLQYKNISLLVCTVHTCFFGLSSL